MCLYLESVHGFYHKIKGKVESATIFNTINYTYTYSLGICLALNIIIHVITCNIIVVKELN